MKRYQTIPILFTALGCSPRPHDDGPAAAAVGVGAGSTGSGQFDQQCPGTKPDVVACCGCPPTVEYVANALSHIRLDSKDEIAVKKCFDALAEADVLGFDVFSGKVKGCIESSSTIHEATRRTLLDAFKDMTRPTDREVEQWIGCKGTVLDHKRAPPDCTEREPPKPAVAECDSAGRIRLPENRGYEITETSFDGGGAWQTALIQDTPPGTIDTLPFNGNKTRTVRGPTEIKVCSTNVKGGAGGCSFSCTGSNWTFQFAVGAGDGFGPKHAHFTIQPQ